MKFFVLFIAVLLSMNSAFAQCVNPSGAPGQVVFNETYDVLQGCTARGWMAFHEPATDPCTETMTSPAIGDSCTDGSIFDGMSPDGDVPMYTTPADAGLFSWNDGTTNHVDIATLTNCTGSVGAQVTCNTGKANTALLVALGTSPSPAPYVAARHCDNLTAHGHSDWYLPARHELDILYTNRTAIGGFNLTGSHPAGIYWSSSESLINRSSVQIFSDGSQPGGNKLTGHSVRCVRR